MLQIIEQTAPSRPRCFDTHAEWVSWLHLAHESGMRVTRRRETSKGGSARYTWQEVLPTDQINYCCDCTSIHRRRMESMGRCEQALAQARKSPPKELTMVYDGIARTAHHIFRAHRMATSSEPAGPAWEAATTKERNAFIARCEAVHQAVRQDQDAKDIGEDAVFFEAVRWLLPTFQAVEHAKTHVEMVAKASEEEQIGALLYIAAMVKRFGGETGMVHMTRQDMEAACEFELMRYDEDDGGLILKVEPKVELAEPPAPKIAGPGVVALDLARAPNE